MKKVLPSLILLVSVSTVEASVGITVLDSGAIKNVPAISSVVTLTTNSVTAPAGALLILIYGDTFFGVEPNPAVTGLSVTWTSRSATGHNQTVRLFAFTAISAGNTGTISVTIATGDTIPSMLYTLLRVDGVLTSVSDGVAANHTITTTINGTPAGQSLGLGSYANAHNVAVQGILFQSCNTLVCGSVPGSTIFTKDPDVGWAASTPVTIYGVPYAGGNSNHGSAIAVQWLIVRGADNSGDYSWAYDGTLSSSHATLILELSAPGTPHRVRQQ